MKPPPRLPPHHQERASLRAALSPEAAHPKLQASPRARTTATSLRQLAHSPFSARSNDDAPKAVPIALCRRVAAAATWPDRARRQLRRQRLLPGHAARVRTYPQPPCFLFRGGHSTLGTQSGGAVL